MSDSQQTGAASSQHCKTIVYISRATPGVVTDEVHRLVFAARAFNAINGVFGLLTYDSRGFLEVLEGSVDAIDEMLAKLERDPRHEIIATLYDCISDTRQFMTFHDFVLEGDRLADVSCLPASSRARLTDDLVAAIEAGYAAL